MDKAFSCARAIRTAAPSLADDDIEEVLSAMIRRERGMPNRKGDALRWREIAAEKTSEELLKLKIEQRARQAALLARTAREVQYGANANKVQAISDRIATSERAGAGRAYSAEAVQHEARQAYVGAIVAGWRAAGVDHYLKAITPEDESALAREIARQNGGKGIETTSRAEIRKAAEAVVGVQRLIREEANGAGAWVSQLDGRVTRTAHDSGRMERAGADRWREFVTPRLAARTWEDAGIDPADAGKVKDFLDKIFGNLVSGNHHVAARGTVDPLSGFKAPGSLARRISEDRVLHWETADDWLAYNREFGGANLVASIISEAEAGAKAIGLLRVWGPNPEAALQQDVTRLADQLRDAGKHAEVEKLTKSMETGGKLWREWRVVTGDADRPVSRTGAHIMASWRALETVTSLGGMVLSALPDLATQASALRHEGVGYWRTLANQTLALLPEGKESMRREVAARVSAGLNGLMGGLYHRMGYDPSAPERITRGVDWFFRMNLQNWWQDSQERGLAGLVTSHLGENLRRGFDQIDPQFRGSLERFGVTADDWARMQAVEPLKDGGTRYFTPDLLPEGMADTRSRVGAWIAETMGGALSKPGVYEKSILTQGLGAGTVMGEAMRMMTQFKSYPLTMLTRHLSREVNRYGDAWGQADFAGLAGLIAGTTILGAVSMTLKDFAAGKNMREVDEPSHAAKFLGRAMVQGGGLGLYGDFLWGDFNRFGGGMIDTAAGPAAGTIAQIGRMWSTARSRAEQSLDENQRPEGNLAAQAVKFVARDVLPTNLFYAKLALDHMVIFRLQEAVNPGYLRRMERQVQRDNNQTFWMPPTDALR